MVRAGGSGRVAGSGLMLGALLRSLVKPRAPARRETVEREAEALAARAGERLRENDPGAARELARRALALQPDQSLAHHCLAQLSLPGAHYLDLLRWFHQTLRPATYFEIGVFRGKSLCLADPSTLCIGLDPKPRVETRLGPNTRVFAETSDAFFANRDPVAELGGRRIDLAFIDGMHHFEFALRDFMNLERHCTRDSVILVHDCYPLDEATAARERVTQFWSGDVWRMITALRRHRPDLDVVTLDAPPTGLGMITRLDPGSTVLATRLEDIVREGLAEPWAAIDARKAEALVLTASDPAALQARLERRRAPG